jgi:chromate transport protein ChrA|tara:strand:+ start:1712 stop:1954 length:243 start_codon:yes stop_codon:yes gene_type:complete
MGIASTLATNVKDWGTLAIVLVVVSIVLTKFKDNSAMTASLNSTVDTFVSALAEPKNWVSIVIIALIGFSMLKLFTSKSR